MPYSKVVPIERRRNKDTIDALRELLAQAEAGHIRGLAFIVEYTSGYDRGATGNCRHNPSAAVGPAMDLVDALRALAHP